MTRVLDATPIVGTTEIVGGWTGTISSTLGEFKPGFVGGGYATAHLNPRFGVRLEALYANKGSAGENSGTLYGYLISTQVSGSNRLTLQYLEIPVLAVFSFPTGVHRGFDLFAGPALAFRAKAQLYKMVTLGNFNGTELSVTRAEQIPIGPGNSGSETEDVTDRIAKTDVSAVLGAGYSRRKGDVILSVDARWTQGFRSVDTAGSGAKNQSFSLSLGLGFPLGSWE
jgi:Outer membrane protein beta-barrel domain